MFYKTCAVKDVVTKILILNLDCIWKECSVIPMYFLAVCKLKIELDKLKARFKNNNVGLYRDDGLAAFKNIGQGTADRLRKQFTECFNEEK